MCGAETQLTEEHVPPQKAFNDCTVFLHKLDRDASPEAKFVPAGRPQQGGCRGYTLCGQCNNDTGDYARSYIEFARACAQYASPVYANKIVPIAGGIRRQKVAKEALVIMCSCCSAEITDEYPDLKRLLLNRNARCLQHPLRLFAYIKCDPGGRRSGKSFVLRVDTRVARHVSDFAWWPLGFALTFNDTAVEEAAEVTHWLDCEYGEVSGGPVHLPCLWTTTPYPLDFRSPREVEKQIAESRAHAERAEAGG